MSEPGIDNTWRLDLIHSPARIAMALEHIANMTAGMGGEGTAIDRKVLHDLIGSLENADAVTPFDGTPEPEPSADRVVFYRDGFLDLGNVPEIPGVTFVAVHDDPAEVLAQSRPAGITIDLGPSEAAEQVRLDDVISWCARLARTERIADDEWALAGIPNVYRGQANQLVAAAYQRCADRMRFETIKAAGA